MRPAEVKRLEWSEIKLEQISEQFPFGLIDLPPAKSKNHNRKLIEITANLKVWLKRHVQPFGPVLPKGKKLQHAQESAEEAAGITWKQNCFRHSFCSYGTAERGATWASEQADHDIRIHKRDYLEVVTKEEGKKYWAIVPKAPEQATETPANVIGFIEQKQAESLGMSLKQFREEREQFPAEQRKAANLTA